MSKWIIPARAGFTRCLRTEIGCSSDHPRSRGVYSDLVRNKFPSGGSSPLARGLPEPSSATPGPTPDHPRSRGVYAATDSSVALQAGSSPLARGLLLVLLVLVLDARIIPARAGFTSKSDSSSHATKDHPRSRGVYTYRSVSGEMPVGSSPLARGLRRLLRLLVGPSGIIPARAGFTTPPARGGGFRGDHPRSRGVYQLRVVLCPERKGSSPLARGLHLLLMLRRFERGIIPARAGFT